MICDEDLPKVCLGLVIALITASSGDQILLKNSKCLKSLQIE
jgi:hypothetical protein